MRRVATAGVAMVVLLGAAFAYASLTGALETAKTAHKRKALTVSGTVEDLQPGVPTVLSVAVRNNLRQKLKMRSLKLSIADASAECPRTMLVASPVKPRKSLPPRKTSTIPVTVTLSAAAPDTCQTATFPIKYLARAKSSRR